MPIGWASEGPWFFARMSRYCGSTSWTKGPKVTASAMTANTTTPASAPVWLRNASHTSIHSERCTRASCSEFTVAAGVVIARRYSYRMRGSRIP